MFVLKSASSIYQVCLELHSISIHVHMHVNTSSCLSLFSYSVVQHILCFVFLRLLYLILTVSLDCQFLIAPSSFSNVYLRQKP